jgi:hypothetical protein
MYQSLSLISSLLSTLDLIMKIVIIILVILVAIIIFLFLFLWPVIPVILTVVGIITTAGMGAAVGGMSSTFCFTGETPVLLADGISCPIKSIPVGANLRGGGTVLGVLYFQQTTEDLFDLYGVRVSGSHIVYIDESPCHVMNHPDAVLLPKQEVPLYCLLTSTQRIPVMTTKGCIEFADWEEIDQSGQTAWNQYVFEALNPGIAWDPTKMDVDIEGEAVFAPNTKVRCGDGYQAIGSIYPGMIVMDADEIPTRVVGRVVMNSECAGQPWRRINGIWRQADRDSYSPHALAYSLLTESGTFLTEAGAVRDFSDVGIQGLPNTYEWVLKHVSGQMKSSS